MDSGKQGTGLENQGLGFRLGGGVKKLGTAQTQGRTGGWPEQPAGGGGQKNEGGGQQSGEVKSKGEGRVGGGLEPR